MCSGKWEGPQLTEIGRGNPRKDIDAQTQNDNESNLYKERVKE